MTARPILALVAVVAVVGCDAGSSERPGGRWLQYREFTDNHGRVCTFVLSTDGISDGAGLDCDWPQAGGGG